MAEKLELRKASPCVLRLYLARYSANCLGPWIMLRWLQKHQGIRFELVDVDIANAEHMSATFLDHNPNHTVPLLVDPCNCLEPTVVSESHAIMRYLARRFDVSGLLDPHSSTVLGSSVCWALEFRLGRLYPALEKVTYPAMGFSQNFENVFEGKFVLDSALRDFAVAFLTNGDGLIGGSQVPTIADFAIAPCLHLITVTDVKFPKAVTEYIFRFMAACPDAMVVADGDGGFGITKYIHRRKELGHVNCARLREYRSSGPGLVLSQGRRLVLSRSVLCVESVPVRIMMALLDWDGFSASSFVELQCQCADPFSNEVPLLESGRGPVAGGCNAVLRYLCEAFVLPALYPGDPQTRAEIDTALDFCCTVLRRNLREALYPVCGLGGDLEKAPQRRSMLPWAAKTIEKMMFKASSGFLCSTSVPSIADVAVVPCLLLFGKLELELSPALHQYMNRCCGHWQFSEELLSQVASAEPALSMVAPASGDLTKVDRLRATADQDLHHKGSVSDPLRMIFHEPLNQLPQSHRGWDALAADLPVLVRDLQVRERMNGMPLLDASAAVLPDAFLARASSLLAIFAHCYWHNEFNNTPRNLPPSLMLPWVQVTGRLGRQVPVMTYEDLYTYNWRGVPRQVTTMRLATPSTGSVAEQRFYLGTVAISYVAAPAVELASRAARQCRLGDHEGVVVSLQQITGCVKELQQTFSFLSLQRRNPGFVDPVLWTMTVATFAMSFVDQLGFTQAIAPSGNSLPILHILDAIFGREVYASDLSQMTKRMLGHEVMAPQHRELVASLRELRLRDLVEASGSLKAIAAWNSMIKAYIGEFGWLGAHRRKVFGFILVAAVVGRPSTLLNFGLNVDTFEKDAEDVNSLLLEEVTARQGTLLKNENENGAAAPSPVMTVQMETLSVAALLEIDLSELCLHNRSKDCWIAISGRVFDVTNFTKLHPGGEHVLGYFAGLDATSAFMTVHSFVRLPVDLCVGVFVQNPVLDEKRPLASFLKQCTLFLNAASLEYDSILQHRCACDEYSELGEQSKLWSPYNLMLLLRMYHKLLDQMLPSIISEMAAFLLRPEFLQITEGAALSSFRRTTKVPERFRSGCASHMAFAGDVISAAQVKIESSVTKVRALGICWLRNSDSVTEGDFRRAFFDLFEAVATLADLFHDIPCVEINRKSKF